MPGGREISGRDVHAALAGLDPPRGDPAALRAAISPDQAFASYEALAAACPPALVGLTPGAHAALFGPLFGEFE